MRILTASLIAGLVATPAFANPSENSADDVADAAQGLSDIVVTARRKSERSIDVPVVITALSAEMIERNAIRDIQGIATLTPQLIIGQTSGAANGSITLRGISSGDTAVGIEQAVSINIDGVQVSHASAVKMGQHDLAQVEILKGPQALFFGKNSTGGIISLSAAEPTADFKSSLSAGYEFNADEFVGEGYVSGPVADNLGFRLAGWYSDMKGYFRNPLPPGLPSVSYPDSMRLPFRKEFGGRLTLSFQPTPELDINAKLSYGHVAGSESKAFAQLAACGGSTPVSGYGDCVLNRIVQPAGNITPAQLAAANDPRFRDGDLEQREKQLLAVLKIAYQPLDVLTLTSITGYYDVHWIGVSGATLGPIQNFVAVSDYDRHDFSQEFRAATSFDGPLNVSGGLYYQSGSFIYESPIVIGPALAFQNIFEVHTDSASAFAQASYKILPTLEFSAGGRFTGEEKKIGVTSPLLGNLTPALVRRTVNASDFSPEFTLTFRPRDNLTVFGSYKRGFKSGGFNTSPTATAGQLNAEDISFQPEKARGGEIGLKTLLFDRALRFEASAFSYKYDDLQVSSQENRGTLVQLLTRNAGAARTRGFDTQFEFAPRFIPDFKLRGALAYSDAIYSSFTNASCYAGQTVALGCNGTLRPNGTFGSQDLSGRRLPRAPKWAGNIGFDYEAAASGNVRFGLSSTATYTGSYNFQSELSPRAVQSAYTLLDAQLRIFDEDRGWEVALIGTNLTNKIIAFSGTDLTLTPTGASTTGTTGVPNFADTIAYTNRPRQVMLRLTIKPERLFGGR